MPHNWFASEYGGEFTDTVDQVFASDLIAQAVNHDLQPLFPDLLHGAPASTTASVRIFGG